MEIVGGIIQARTGSSRFPHKVLSDLHGVTVLERYIDRVKHSAKLDKIIIATTNKKEDRTILDIAIKTGVAYFCGSETDLIDRYYKCAKEYNLDVIVRLTSDDCFVDPDVIDKGIRIRAEENADFVTNHFTSTFPEGLDIEIYDMNIFGYIWKKAKLKSEREHVFPYIKNNSHIFNIHNFYNPNVEEAQYRWTIDYDCDLDMAKKVYDHLYKPNKIFKKNDIVKLLKRYPEIATINSHIKRKEGVNKTIQNDGVMK